MTNKQKTIVLVGGCFDVLHQGHFEFLKSAKNLGSKLIVLLESDENVKKLKGTKRPINKLSTRSKNLFATGLVDIIIHLDSNVDNKYYETIVKKLNPDIIAVTEGDPLLSTKSKHASLVNAEISVIRKKKGFSTTNLLNKK